MALYYSTQLNSPLTTESVRETFGFNPDTYNVGILNEIYNLYPVNTAEVPVYDTNLYSGVSTSYLINFDGVSYDQTYSLIERPLAEAQEKVIARMRDTSQADALAILGGIPIATNPDNDFEPRGPWTSVGGESPELFAAQSFLTAANRIEPYKTMAVSIQGAATTLQNDIAAVNAATDIAGVKNAYRPTTGSIDVTRSGNNITAAEFTSLINADPSEMTFVIQSSGTILYYDENNNGFTALGGELSPGSDDFELFVGSISLGLFTIPGGNATTNFTF